MTLETLLEEYEYEPREDHFVVEPSDFESLELRVWPDLRAELVDLRADDYVVERSDLLTRDGLRRLASLLREDARRESLERDW